MALEVSELKVQNKIIVGTQELTSAVTSVGGTGTVAGLTLSGTVTTTGNLTLGGTLSTPISTINDSTTVGQNLVKLANPSAIRFIRINANNTVDALTDANFRTAIGAGTSSTTGTVTGVTGTAPIVSSGGTAPAISISAATQSVAGSMSSADKTKLDGIATGATANTGTVTSVGITAGTGISVSGSPVTGSGSITVTNSSPDQTVALTGAGNVSITGTYPNFTITGSSSGSGTVTSVGGTGTISGLTLTGTVTTSGNLTLGGTLAVAASNFASQTANTFLAAPNGTAGVPTFRAIVAADVPTLNQNTTGNAATVTVVNAGPTETNYILFSGGTGSPKIDAALMYNGITSTLSAPVFSGNLSGNATTATNVAYSGLTGTVPTWNQNTTGTSEASNRNIVFDVRDTNKTPAQYNSHRSIFEFNNLNLASSTWWGVMTVKGWDGSYAAWQLAGPASVGENKNDLFFRGGQESTWGDWRRLYHSGVRDITLSTSTGGNFGNRLIVGNTDTSFTLQDSNLRPTIHAHGAYPVLSLNHTVTSNTSHGPTVQFTANGTGNQFVIGMTGNGSRLDIGTSSNSSWNPHNGIADYLGPTIMSFTTSGTVGIGTLTTTAKLDVNGGIRTRGSEYNRFDTWTDLPAHAGFYSSVHNGAHFLPNNGTYGAWKIQGSRNGWRGLEFETTSGGLTLMVSTDGNTTGWHNNNYGWQTMWQSGTFYVNKNTYGGGTQAVVLDSSNRGSYAAAVNSTSTVSGGVKTRLSGNTLYITNNGNNP